MRRWLIGFVLLALTGGLIFWLWGQRARPVPAAEKLMPPLPAGLEQVVMADGRALVRGHDRLLAYLEKGHPEDLQAARQALEGDAGVYQDVAAASQAFCLQLDGKEDEASALLHARDIDADIYAWWFGDREAAKRGLVNFQAEICAIRRQALDQAVALFSQGQGRLPDTIGEMNVPDPLPCCPGGDPYVWRTSADRPEGYELRCAHHAAPKDFVHFQLFWKLSPRRVNLAQVDAIVRGADIGPGSRVADVGAGIGYYSALFARRVAPGGAVWAVDISKPCLDYVRFYQTRHPDLKLEILQSRPDDACLPAGQFDVVVLGHILRHIFPASRNDPRTLEAFLDSLRRGLRPKGRCVVVDERVDDPHGNRWLPSAQQVIETMTARGFRHLPDRGVDRIARDFFPVVPYDYVLVFEVSP